MFGEKYTRLETQTDKNKFLLMNLIPLFISLLIIWINGLSSKFGVYYDNIQVRSIFLGVTMTLVFLSKHMFKNKKRVNIIDILMIIAALFCAGYCYHYSAMFQLRLGSETILDIIVGALLVILVIEGCRRTIGLVMPTIASIFILYALWGQYFPKILAHKGYTLSRIFGYMFMTNESIFGSPLGTAASYVALFVVYASFLQKSGGGEAFMDMAFSMFGKVRGGPAKVAVVGSCLFGSINGSAVANVVGTGSFTIPLMKRTGYHAEDAAAIEAVASTGGQIMPPIMGSAAFIMAETLNIPYLHIAAAAFLPAVLYYCSIFLQVDLAAVKLGLKGLPKEQLPKFMLVFKKYWHILLSPVILIVLMVAVGLTALMSAMYALILLLITSTLRRATRMSVEDIVDALCSSGRGVLEVAMATACAGIIVGVFSLTGLGGKLSSALLILSGGKVLSLLLLCMVCSIVLGMGMPTTGAYIILSVLVAPSLYKLGLPLLTSHMFVFYFGAISAITPPVALASMAGAGIAESDVMKTGWRATVYGIAAFIIPYYFVYRPSLLLMGTFWVLAWDFCISLLGIAAFGIALQGHLFIKLNMIARIAIGVVAFILSMPSMHTDIAGVVILAVIALILYKKGKKQRKVEKINLGEGVS